MKYKIRKLTKKNLKEIRTLEFSIQTNQSYTKLDNDFFINTLMSSQGLVLGVFINNVLVGFSASAVFDESKSNLLKDFNTVLKDKINAKETVFFASTLIHPKARGYGLQKTLRKATISHFREEGITNFITTVSTSNKRSLHNLRTIGMIKVGEKILNFSRELKTLLIKQYDSSCVMNIRTKNQ